MIVKVQRSMGNNTVLIYNRSRTHLDIQPFTDEIKKKMGGSYRRFFNAVSQNGTIVLKDAVPARNW